MIEILLGQKFNAAIPAGASFIRVKVAHKTGTITGINHDAAIIYPGKRKPYVLVVLTRGIADEQRAHTFIASLIASAITNSSRLQRSESAIQPVNGPGASPVALGILRLTR